MPTIRDLRTTARILEHRASQGRSVTISSVMALRLAALCRDIAGQEEGAA